jgi:membrane protease YdiL (CAAX protease family)
MSSICIVNILYRKAAFVPIFFSTVLSFDLARFPGRPTFAPMRPLRSIFLFSALVFLGGALLAPWVFFIAQWAAAHLPGCAGWREVPFHRFVHRCFILAAILGLPWFLRGLGYGDSQELRQALQRPCWKPLAGGIAIGFLSLAFVLACQLMVGARGWSGGLAGGGMVRHLAGAAATALAVAAIEEVLFRWALYGTLRKVYAKGFSMVLSAAIYAIVHFFSRPESPLPITWLSGLALLPRMLRGFGDWQALVPGFFNLLIIGCILALAFERTGRLWFSIGLHGGWIFWLKMGGLWTAARVSTASRAWGTDKMIDGVLTSVVLIFIFFIVKLRLLKPKTANNLLG